MIKLELPFVTKSNNQLLRMHWAVRRKLKVSYMDYLMLAIKWSKYKSTTLQATGKRKCHIMSYRKRLLDRVNLYGGVKPLEDALVDFGMLIDDNPDMCDLKVGQKKSKNPRTVITLRDIKEE